VVAVLKADWVTFEVHDSHQKQSNRNRAYSYNPDGKQCLNIPVKHLGSVPHQQYKEVQFEYAERCKKIRYKSLEIAYRSSPFFEYFEDDLMPIFESKHQILLDFNFEVFEILQSCLGTKIQFDKSTEYQKTPENHSDFRYLVDGKRV